MTPSVPKQLITLIKAQVVFILVVADMNAMGIPRPRGSEAGPDQLLLKSEVDEKGKQGVYRVVIINVGAALLGLIGA